MTHFLVTTGPESSGKTTLANDLRAQLAAPLVPEASRGYLQALYQRQPGSRYQQSDLLQIAQLQYQAEQRSLASQAPLVVCDTDLLVIIIWSEVVYGNCEAELLELFASSLQQHPRTYLLCDYHIPWEADPLRENPHDRELLFVRYLDKLQSLKLPYLQVQGPASARLEQTIRHLG